MRDLVRRRGPADRMRDELFMLVVFGEMVNGSPNGIW